VLTRAPHFALLQWIICLLASAGCKRHEQESGHASAAASAESAPGTSVVAGVTAPARNTAQAAAVSNPAPVIAAPAAPRAATVKAVHDFDDEFEYGSSAGPIDAGLVDAAALAASKGFRPYFNRRFGFSLEVPKGLLALPAPENGDGMQWRFGNLVAMTASGMNASTEVGIREYCATSPNVIAHQETGTSCWATGTRHGFVFWERNVIAHDIAYSLRFQYAESLKSAMDSVVAHVNRSWRF